MQAMARFTLLVGSNMLTVSTSFVHFFHPCVNLIPQSSYANLIRVFYTKQLIQCAWKTFLLVYELLCLLLIKASHMWFLCSKPINLCIIFDGCNAPANVKLLFMRVLLVHLLFLIDAFHRFYLWQSFIGFDAVIFVLSYGLILSSILLFWSEGSYARVILGFAVIDFKGLLYSITSHLGPAQSFVWW